MRVLPLIAAITLALAAPLATSQQASTLPDIGSSAGEMLTPALQAEYGGMMLRELRNYGYLLEDPLLDEWLQNLGSHLGADSDSPRQAFTFFLMRDRQINAFATLGGYIGTNAGLILTAEKEDEVAAVLSHEIAHVTQQHVLRGAERAQRDQIPILLGMLGAILVAQSAGGSSSGEASQAALASAMGLMAQRQIDYTRSNESEADRLGIRTLSRAGYDVDAMADFFSRMDKATRANRGGDRERAPDYLMTHPVTTTRISEAKQRAEQIRKDQVQLVTSVPGGGKRVESFDPKAISATEAPSGNPLLPLSVTLPADIVNGGATGEFDWARERLRALSASTPGAAVREYDAIRRGAGGKMTDPQRYGLAVAYLNGGKTVEAYDLLTQLAADEPDQLWVALALAEAESRLGRKDAANQRYSQLLQRRPNNRAIVLSFATALNEQGGEEAGRRAQAVLRPLMASAADDPAFQQQYARANELAGDLARAGEAYAETTYLNGRPEQALTQLENLKKRGDLDYYARARIDARIAAITPEVLELRRQGIRDPDLQRR
ncbi:M48 family metalloprotease [Pseudoxanthomonas dokdonensis]|uniref:Putative beta-barrel assembly-enhancing protease n=1 Tax=Pseudoxanthomonas dokdonensis TaxID=344882 RepID=A0A0R0CEC5_9GAMM|nr:M48 family metalloprotease [Pseudoxanthomonas dokdonensis]KRG68105.1 peptidase [Pseudoxanthomonas dokdonensis]